MNLHISILVADTISDISKPCRLIKALLRPIMRINTWRGLNRTHFVPEFLSA